MVHTELTVTGLRCIEHTELEIPPRVVPGCGGRGSGDIATRSDVSSRSAHIVPYEKQ